VITAGMKRRIKHELSNEKPTIWIGKENITTQIIDETDKQLKTREMVKIRILNTALKEEKAKNIASKVAQQTNSVLIEVRGHTFMLYRTRKQKRMPRKPL
jgi:putative YhbY family RNA-binding protein